MTNDDAINRLRSAQATWVESLLKEVLTIASDLNAQIIDRVQNDGLNADGNEFGTYSPVTQMIKQRKRHTQPPFPQVNFTDTGEMLRNTTPQVRDEGTTIVVTIAPRSQANVTKMEYNVDSFGSIIEASPDELKITKRAIELRGQRLLDRLTK